MNTEEQVIYALWEEPVLKIKNNVPVYFDFTKEKTEDILNSKGIKYNDVLELLRTLLSHHLEITSNGIHLLDSLYMKNQFGFSPCILMICVQVIAVEDMVKNDQYTENAYFPRLREILSRNLSVEAQNPFSYSDFRSIWKNIEDEIYNLGGDKSLITFNLREISGANKSRHFPLSQALLCGEDILKLVSILRDKKGASNEDISYTIDSNRVILTARGKKLVALPWLRTGIVNQLKFAASNQMFFRYIEKEIKERKDLFQLYDLAIYIDSSDWFNEEYVIGTFNKSDQHETPLKLAKKMVENFSGFYIALTSSKFEDSWVVSSQTKTITSGSTFFIVYLGSNETSLKALLDQTDIKNHADVEFGVFTRSEKLSYCRVDIIDSDFHLVIDNGKVAPQCSNSVTSSEVKFVGGVSVNSGIDIYDCYNLPDAIVINGLTHELEGCVEVNLRKVDFQEFRASVRMIKCHESFSITLNSGEKFRLKVAPRTANADKFLAFPVAYEGFFPHYELSSRNSNQPLSAIDIYDESNSDDQNKYLHSLKQKQFSN